METPAKYQVSLCRRSSCCPQLLVDGDNYFITDDNGGRVTLTTENMEELVRFFQANDQQKFYLANLGLMDKMMRDDGVA